MGIIINDQDLVSTTILEQKKANTAMFTNLRLAFEKRFAEIWNHPSLTPIQVMEGYGTDGALLFNISSKIKVVLSLVDPSYTPPAIPERYTYTINQDGSVTITDSQE